jgi:hypothetical protein
LTSDADRKSAAVTADGVSASGTEQGDDSAVVSVSVEVMKIVAEVETMLLILLDGDGELG